MEYIEWTNDALTEYLSDKQMRSVHVAEYGLLIDYINKIMPDTVIDVGTYRGSSGYILGTCCDSIKYLYSIENIDSPEYYSKPESTKEQHGEYLPKDAIFITTGYDNTLGRIVKEHPNCFVFWDAGKNTMKVMGQIQLSYHLGVKHIAFHDSGMEQKTVRRAIKRACRMGLYKIVAEDIESCPSKGVTILERIDAEN